MNLSVSEHPFFRSSRSQISLKLGVLKILAIFTGRHLFWSLFLIMLQALSITLGNIREPSGFLMFSAGIHRALNLVKIRFQHMCFSVSIAKMLRTIFIYRTPLTKQCDVNPLDELQS